MYTGGANSDSELALTNWAVECLTRSYLRQNYDVTKYWSVVRVRRLSNSALELSYR